MFSDDHFMQRALDLAQNGLGTVSPNPMVGCVIVHDGRIIGEGWHRKAGEPHAEVLAMQSVKERHLIPDSTVYVSLEPCAHYGKTPPCTDLLVREKVKRVVVATVDDNPQVGGKGIAKLKAAGIVVSSGVLEKEARFQNRRFFTHIKAQRPYIILKWAQSADGFIAKTNFDSKWISGAYSRQLVHKWRSEEDAILVGKNTASYDNPSLSTRDWKGKSPLRVLIDKNLDVPGTHQLLSDGHPTLVFNVKQQGEEGVLQFIALKEADFINLLLISLHDRNIQSIIIEGGAATLQSFIDAGLWDEARVFTGLKTLFGEGIAAPRLTNFVQFDKPFSVENDSLQYYIKSV
jgi:diaminohydroxyphosphoribosylaminopyrimidine deaminase / 5-amino-6-(5-phosphoribosylamino)uracil reductase